MQRTKEDIVALIQKGERLHAECKEAFGALPDALWESYSAFANTDGGVILLGVKERDDHSFFVQGVKDADALIKCFWDTANNAEKVSLNVVDRRGVYAVDCDGKQVVVIEVPRADRHDRPVFIGHDVFEGSYRRNGEGDYMMKRESVETMIRDKCIVTADACILEEVGVDELNADTIRRYRSRFARIKVGHIWNNLPDDEFLAKIGAAKRIRGEIHPTLAGMICFGDFNTITDVAPHFFLDYRERLSDETRWSDRVCAHDATWSGNIYDFYFKIYDRIVSDIKIPFKMGPDGISAEEETDVHRSVRELVANALIHADYFGRQGIVIEKCFRQLSFANPGTFLISKEDAIAGGNSEPRNEKIFNIFALVKIGERSGAGLSDLYGQWEKYGFTPPVIEEKYDPDRTVIRVAVEVGSGKGSVESSVKSSKEGGQEVDKDRTTAAQQLHKNCTRTAQELLADISSSARRVYRSFAEDGEYTQEALVSKLGLSRRTIASATATLIKRGLLRRVGPKKGGHWEIVK